MADTHSGDRQMSPDAREYRGEWWTVDSPASRLGGTLTHDVEAAQLVVHGQLLDVSDATRPIILGEAGGTRVTIINYSPIRTTTQGNGAVTQIFDTGEFLVGDLVPEPESETFKVIELDSHTLRALGQVATRPKVETTDDAPNEYSVRISVPPVRSCEVEGLGRVTLCWHIRSTDGVTSGSLEAWPVLRLDATAGLTMDDTWQRFAVPVAFLLTLASGRGDRIKVIRLAKTDRGPGVRSMEWAGLPWIGEGDLSPADVFQALLSYDDIAEGLDSLLPRWFELFDHARTALIDFFSVPMSKALYVEDSVLRTVRAIEGYHRSTIGGTYFDEQQFKTLFDLLKEAARTSNERNFVTMRLQYGNEPTLKQRLDAIVDRAGEPLADLIGEFDAFTRRVKEVRNSLAHDGVLGDAFTESELFVAEKVLQLLMRAVLLRDLGMNDDEIAKRIKRSGQWHTVSAPDNPLLKR